MSIVYVIVLVAVVMLGAFIYVACQEMEAMHPTEVKHGGKVKNAILKIIEFIVFLYEMYQAGQDD